MSETTSETKSKSGPDEPPPENRVLLVIISLLLSMIAGLVGGILATANGATLTGAFIYGIGAFALSVPLILLVMRELGLLK